MSTACRFFELPEPCECAGYGALPYGPAKRYPEAGRQSFYAAFGMASTNIAFGVNIFQKKIQKVCKVITRQHRRAKRGKGCRGGNCETHALLPDLRAPSGYPRKPEAGNRLEILISTRISSKNVDKSVYKTAYIGMPDLWAFCEIGRGRTKFFMCDGNDICSRLTDPLHRDAYRYWLSKSPDGRLPSRDAIDPLELPSVLPWVNLIDVVRDGNKYRFRHRLIGTGIVARYGRDATGAWLDELYAPEILAEHIREVMKLVESGQPFLDRISMPIPEKSFMTYQRLALPLASDGVTVDKVMVVLAFDEPGGG